MAFLLRTLRPSQSTPTPVVLVASSSSRQVSLVSASSLRSNKGARKTKIRVGRGEAAETGEGKGRGTKGQGARAGRGTTFAFEGGQTPLTKIYPKKGFFNFQRKQYEPISLGRIQQYIDLKRLDPTEPITVEHIFKSGMVAGFRRTNGFKLLADGFETLKQPLTILPHRASAAAIQAVEATGGSLSTIYHNRLSFRQAIRPESFEGYLRVKEALPMKKRDILYYTNWEKRGYLAKRPSDAPSTRSPSVVVPADSLDQRFKHETTAKYATGKGR